MYAKCKRNANNELRFISVSRYVIAFFVLRISMCTSGISCSEDFKTEEAEIFAKAIFPQTVDTVQDFEGCLDTIYHACVFREGSTKDSTNFTAIYHLKHATPKSREDQGSKSYEFLHGTQLGQHILRNHSVHQLLGIVRRFFYVTMAAYNTEFFKA